MPANPKAKRKPLRVILDSNALFVPLQFNIDIFEEVEELLNNKCDFILLSPIRRELETLAEKGSPKIRRKASFALKMAEKCKVIDDLDEEYAGSPPDEVVLQVARDWSCPVFTNDKTLRKKLRNINVPVIYVRGKSRLEIDGKV